MSARPAALLRPAQERALVAHLADYTDWMRDDRGLAPVTRHTYRQRFAEAERFTLNAFDVPLLRATEEHLRAFLNRHEWARTRNGHRSMLRSYYSFTRETGRRKDDPTSAIRRHPEPRLLPRPLNREEVRRLRVAAQTLGLRHRVIVDLALLAGARRSEIAALPWGAVDFRSRQIRFFGKGAKEGIIPMHEDLWGLLTLWHLAAPPSEYVFPSYNGRHLSPERIWEAVKEAGQVARVDVTPHRLRHTFATELLEAGSDVRAVQELLRHASLNSTQIYTKVSMRRLEEDVARLDYAREGLSRST